MTIGAIYPLGYAQIGIKSNNSNPFNIRNYASTPGLVFEIPNYSEAKHTLMHETA
jgi:hypothetical protein